VAAVRHLATAGGEGDGGVSARGLALVVGALALALGVGIGVTHAAFSSTTTSPSNYTSDTRYDGLRLATGSYTGNGADGRKITSPNFRPDVVIIKADTAQIGVIRTSTMSGDATKLLSGGTALSTNHIESLDESGFTVGTNARVNSSGVTYQWVALKSESLTLKVGTYTGSGVARSITGVGFSPSFVAVMGAGATAPVLRMTGMTRAFAFDSGTGSTTQITSLDANGFSLGTDSAVNTNGTAYHYIAFEDATGTSKVGTYTGNATAGRSITGTGFQPSFVLVRANDTATSRAGRQRPASLTGTNSQGFNALANVTTSITALQSNGFQVGNDASVNANSVAYYYLTLKDVGP
jgi:predicted ribosomally synthesized peptide with SipW-like signal peptide